MTDSAAELLDLLRERRLLPDALIDSLRKQVAAAPQPLGAHHIAKLLQQKGKITAFQARELLADVEGRRAESAASSTGVDASAETPAASQAPASDDELGLATVEEDVPKTQRREAKLAAAAKSLAKAPATAPAATAAVAPSLSGGIDDLLSDPALTATSAGGYDPLGIAQPKRKGGWFGGGVVKRKPRAGGWESPLLIVGGGALLLLLLVGSTLALVLLRSSGEEIFKAAELDYSNGAYGQAIGKYEKFLRGRAKHPQASRARVRIALAQLRTTVAGGDAAAALARAQAILPQVEREPALAESRPELASLLPGIAESFVDGAAKASDPAVAAQQVEQYRAAMKLVNHPTYLPTSVKAPLTAQLARMQEKIDGATRAIEQDDRLHEAIAEIQAATKKRNAAAAYEIQRELLQKYPNLTNHDQLVAAVVAISASLREQVQAASEDFAEKLSTEDHPSPTQAEVALAKTSGEPVPALAGRIVPVVVDGVLYVLAADSGKLLWRRFVGRGVASATLTSDDDQADVLVVDARRQELLRLRGTDGQLAWRLALGEEFAVGPLRAGRVYLSLVRGMLLAVELDSGEVAQQIVFPQRLTAIAALDATGKTLLQCGDHSNLYVHDAETLACRDVFYLGHKVGTIELPPVFVGPLIAVAQQVGLRRSQVQVLAWTGGEPTLQAAHKPLSIDQRLCGPLLVAGQRAIAVDRSSGVHALQVDESDAPSLAVVAEKAGALDDGAPYAALAGGLLVVGDRRLAGYRISTARGGLPAEWATHDQDRFVAPLQTSGEHLFHVRRIADQAGVFVTATALAPDDPQAAGQPLWQTHLALEPTGAALEGRSGNVEAWCASGDLFAVPHTLRGNTAISPPIISAAISAPVGRIFAPTKTRQIIVGGLEPLRATVVDFASADPRAVERLVIRLTPSAPVASWNSGLLIPTAQGQINYFPLDGDTDSKGNATILPFFPQQQPGETIDWLGALPLDEQRFFASDRGGRVFVVSLDSAGAPHLSAVQESQIDGPLIAQPAITGAFAVVVQRTNSFDCVIAISLEDLLPSQPLALAGRCRWGPHAVGDLALLATDPGGLVAVQSPAVEAWTRDLHGDLPIGEPLAVAQSVWIATTAGRIVELARDTGEIVRQVDLGEPLGCGLAIVGQSIVARAADGTLLFVEASP